MDVIRPQLLPVVLCVLADYCFRPPHVQKVTKQSRWNT